MERKESLQSAFQACMQQDETDEELERRLMESAHNTECMSQDEYDEYSMNMALYGSPFAPSDQDIQGRFWGDRDRKQEATGFNSFFKNNGNTQKPGTKMDVER